MEISRQINRLIEKSLSNEINRERTTVTAIFISNPEEYSPQTNPRVRIAVRTAGTLNDGREASEYIATKIGVEILSSINRDVLDEVHIYLRITCAALHIPKRINIVDTRHIEYIPIINCTSTTNLNFSE